MWVRVGTIKINDLVNFRPDSGPKWEAEREAKISQALACYCPQIAHFLADFVSGSVYLREKYNFEGK